jgi:hypothetical protein
MASISPCSLKKYLIIFPRKHSDYEHLYRFHYLSAALGPTRAVYKLIDEHPWRRLAAPLVEVIVYGLPSANLAARNAATGGFFLDWIGALPSRWSMSGWRVFGG